MRNMMSLKRNCPCAILVAYQYVPTRVRIRTATHSSQGQRNFNSTVNKGNLTFLTTSSISHADALATLPQQ